MVRTQKIFSGSTMSAGANAPTALHRMLHFKSAMIRLRTHLTRTHVKYRYYKISLAHLFTIRNIINRRSFVNYHRVKSTVLRRVARGGRPAWCPMQTAASPNPPLTTPPSRNCSERAACAVQKYGINQLIIYMEYTYTQRRPR